MSSVARWLLVLLCLGIVPTTRPSAPAADLSGKSGVDFIRVSPDGHRFVHSGSGAEFRPWGFNYDHDAANRLLETYWQKEWSAVVGDFEEMKQLGANTVRVHLQVSRFMKSARQTNRQSLAQLGRLLTLAEKTGLYLDITGLGCYDRDDVPPWYDKLDEQQRWDVQARFWEAVAETCRNSPAVFCYDLMNEPVLSEDKQHHDWTPGAFGDRYFVQRLTLDFAGRTPTQIAAAWSRQLVAAIRKHDRRHLVTVGAIPWTMTWPTAKPVIYSQDASTNLDFVSLHFYPKKTEVEKALKALEAYNIGKPIVVEEMFPLSCSVAELNQFIERSQPLAVGWLGFYWGKTIAQYHSDKASISDAITLDWLEYFVRKTPQIVHPTTAPTNAPGNPKP